MKKRFLQIIRTITIIILFYSLFQCTNNFLKTQQIKKVLYTATAITIYKVSCEEDEVYTEEQLSKEIKFTVTNPKKYFKEIHYKKGSPLWKGEFLGRIYLKNNTIIELIWSTYGDFFAVKNEKGYYSF